MLAVPNVRHSSLCVLVIRLPEEHCYAATILNFARHSLVEDVDLSAMANCEGHSLAGKQLIDAVTGEAAATIGGDNHIVLNVPDLSGKTLILRRTGA